MCDQVVCRRVVVHVGGGERAQWTHRQSSLANVVEDSVHQSRSEAVASVRRIGFDVGDRDDTVIQSIGRQSDSNAIEVEFVAAVLPAFDHRQFSVTHCDSLAVPVPSFSVSENHDHRSGDHSDRHTHRHTHRHTSRQSGVRLGIAAGSNTAFAVVQIIVGLAIGSIVVLADAAHQAVDALGLITAWIAIRVARRPASDEWSYGLGKADALGGFVSGLLLIGSVVWIVIESVKRLVDPTAVDGGGVILIGFIAIAVNGAGVLLVGHGHGDEAISLRAARLHLLADLAGSVVVVIAGVLLVVTSASWVDPAASLLVSAAVLWSTWNLIGAAANVLLDRSPSGKSVSRLGAALLEVPDVEAVHHVHIRSLGGGRHAGSAHLVVDGSLSTHRSQEICDDAAAVAASVLGVEHLTLQVECLHGCVAGGDRHVS